MAFTDSGNPHGGPRPFPSAASLGMTPANPLNPLAPDFLVRGSLGGFQMGSAYNDYYQTGRTYSWADTLSWTHGRHTIRTGVFVLRQHLDTIQLGLARGRLFFQNFSDLLLGMSAAQNGSPQGLSNIQTIDANAGAGPDGPLPGRRRRRCGCRRRS